MSASTESTPSAAVCPMANNTALESSPIDRVIRVAPSALASTLALSRVSSLVPNPGMVTHTRSLRCLPSRSRAAAATSAAAVESNPPDTPRTSVGVPIACMRVSSAFDWISNISQHRLASVLSSAGRNGVGLTVRIRSLLATTLNGHRRHSRPLSIDAEQSPKVLVERRSKLRASRSMS